MGFYYDNEGNIVALESLEGNYVPCRAWVVKRKSTTQGIEPPSRSAQTDHEDEGTFSIATDRREVIDGDLPPH